MVTMYCATKTELPNLYFDIDFDLASFALHFYLVFNLRRSFSPSHLLLQLKIPFPRSSSSSFLP